MRISAGQIVFCFPVYAVRKGYDLTMPAGPTPDLGLRRSGGSGDLRQGNLTQILRYVRDHGASSRHDIARGCGLGISTMTDLIGELRARRIVKELRSEERRVGEEGRAQNEADA